MIFNMDEYKIYARQLGIIKPSELDFPIALIGAGGIGSWTALSLCKMGVTQLTVFDFDKVEDKNTPSQFYTLKEKGMNKVSALKRKIKAETGSFIKAMFKNFYHYPLEENYKVIVIAVDSLEERKKIWDFLVKSNSDFDVLIDARMAGDFIRIFFVDIKNDTSVKKYVKTLNNSAIVHEELCTERSVVYNVFICAGLISNLIKKYAKKESSTIPFNINFDLKDVRLI